MTVIAAAAPPEAPAPAPPGDTETRFDRGVQRVNGVLSIAVALLTIAIIPTFCWVVKLETKVAEWTQLAAIRKETNDKQDSRLDGVETGLGNLKTEVAGYRADQVSGFKHLETLIQMEREDRKELERYRRAAALVPPQSAAPPPAADSRPPPTRAVALAPNPTPRPGLRPGGAFAFGVAASAALVDPGAVRAAPP